MIYYPCPSPCLITVSPHSYKQQGLKTRAGLQYNGVTGVVVTASTSTGNSGSGSDIDSTSGSASGGSGGGNNNRVGVRLDAPYAGKV